MGEVKKEEPSLEEVKSSDNNADNKEKDTSDSASKVEITEEPPNSAAGQGEQLPKPIIEEPNSNTVPQLNVIPDGSENTVITEIIANETPSGSQEEKPKLEEQPKPEEPK